MDFITKTDKQLKEENLISEGEYRYIVLHTTQKTSAKDGSEYFSLKLRVTVNNRERTALGLLKFEGNLMYLAKQFCDSHNLTKQWEAGKIMPHECDGKEGILVMTQTTNSQTGELQNFIKGWKPLDEVEVKAEFKDDSDIPF